jgi:PIN domain nuclease of toxin-antitoxin system
LGKKAREFVADPANDILVSMVSFWEIAVKVRVGKLAADLGEIMTTVSSEAFTLLEITQSHYRTLMTLPVHHRDPFDPLLIAQAITEMAFFLSEDGHVSAYPVQVIRCSSRA